MSDLELLDRMAESSHLVVGNRKYYHWRGYVVEATRVGKGPRWSFGSRDIYRAASLPRHFSSDVREWVQRAERLDVVGHARAMSARVL